MSRTTSIDSKIRVRPLTLIAFALVALCATAYAVYAFDSGYTNRAIARGNAALEQCRSVAAGAQRQNCVGNALNSVARNIGARRDYRPAASIFREAAAGVKAAKSVRRALSALDSARKKLLRASGRALQHHKLLSTLMSKAKSVLRS